LKTGLQATKTLSLKANVLPSSKRFSLSGFALGEVPVFSVLEG